MEHRLSRGTQYSPFGVMKHGSTGAIHTNAPAPLADISGHVSSSSRAVSRSLTPGIGIRTTYARHVVPLAIRLVIPGSMFDLIQSGSTGSYFYCKSNRTLHLYRQSKRQNLETYEPIRYPRQPTNAKGSFSSDRPRGVWPNNWSDNMVVRLDEVSSANLPRGTVTTAARRYMHHDPQIKHTQPNEIFAEHLPVLSHFGLGAMPACVCVCVCVRVWCVRLSVNSKRRGPIKC